MLPFFVPANTVCHDREYQMKDQSKTKQELLEENAFLKQRIKELEQSELERKRAEEALRKSQYLFRLILDTVPQSIFWKDKTSTYLGCNKVFAKAVGFADPEQIVGKTDFDLPWPKADAEAYRTEDAEIITSGTPKLHIIEPMQKADGRLLWIDISTIPLLDAEQEIFGVLGVYENITERKQAEESLLESESRFRSMVGEMAVIAEISRVIGSTLEIDEVYERFTDEAKKLIPVDSLAINLYNFQENTLHVAHVSGVNIDRRKQGDSLVLEGSLSEAVIRAQTGLRIQPANIDEIVSRFPRLSTIFQAELRSIMCVPLVSRNEVIGVLHFRSKTPNAYTEKDLGLAERIGAQIAGAIANAQLFSDLKQAEEALQRVHNELEQRVADRTEELMRANEELRTEITERKRAEEAIVVAKNDWKNTFDTATDMITIHDKDFNIVRANQAAKAILGLQLLEEMPLAKCFRFYHGTEKPPSGCASCESLQTGRPSTVEVFEPHLNKYLEIRAMPRFGSDGQLVGLIHVVRDITERRKAEEQLQQTLESLRKALGTIIQVMVSAVDVRDPYTAGHQVRSADIARAIATEMGLSQEKIDGIRMAGSIHDIGKLSIPAEILSKPSKLSEIEFSLIKEHARIGFEMLKDVESPWPLAEIVYQHHERMDGSGYPRKLKRDEILMEARIMAVADVVEAMASHRPYRPGLGIDAALNEIEKNRGIFYDNTVADACLRLFREKGFKIDGA
jgi:PAS domain S-box-containing protein